MKAATPSSVVTGLRRACAAHRASWLRASAKPRLQRRVHRAAGPTSACAGNAASGAAVPHLVLRTSVVDAFPDQTDAPRFFRRGACRPSMSDPSRWARRPTRQQPGAAAIGDQPDLRERLDEARRARRDTMSQPSAMFAPAPPPTPLTAVIYRHRHRPDPQRQRLVEALDRRRRVGLRAGAPGGATPDPRGLAGAEAAPGAGNDQQRTPARPRRQRARRPIPSCIAPRQLFSDFGRLSVSVRTASDLG